MNYIKLTTLIITSLVFLNSCGIKEDLNPKECRKAGGIYKKIKTHNFLTGKDEYRKKCIEKNK